jgi:hypothetical protein
MSALSGIAKLMAIDAICLLKARRDRACDTKDWDLYASLHAPDHVSENGDYGRWTSTAEMMLYVPKSMRNLTTLHQSHTPDITFETATTARGIWAMEGMSFWQQDSGHYFESYEVRGGRWLFTSRKLTYYHTRKSEGAIFPPKID